jgi:predicted glycosyltransferase
MTSKIWFLPKKPYAKRILIHAINHVGLGHLNRSIVMAQWLQAGIPDLQTLLLIEGGEYLIEPTGFPWIMVPGQSTEREHSEQITRTVLDVFRPSLVIHDTLIREFVYKPARDVGVRQVLVGRIGGILKEQFQHNLPMINEMNLLIIPHQREHVAPFYQAFISQYSGKTVYAGPLVRPPPLVSSDDLMQKLCLSSVNKVILATFGGGGWDIARTLLASLLAAKDQILEKYPQAKLIVITGPHFSGELPEVSEFVCYASRFESSLADYLNIASAVVCMAGYNTVNEVASSGVPAICVPAPEAEDQVGAGGMGEYAQSFPNIVVSTTETELLARHITNALGHAKYVSVTQEFRRRAEIASQRVVAEIKGMLDAMKG